jgi:hypothetical protein
MESGLHKPLAQKAGRARDLCHGLSHEWWALKEERTLIVRRIIHGRSSHVYA